MSDWSKTSVYVVVAVALVGVAFVAKPRQATLQIDERVGKALFEDFTDPNKVQSLEITRYDEDLGEIRNFKVARNSRTGLWTIPSHSDYPADAEDRIRDAATIFVGLDVIGLVTQDAGEHELFGVVEPDKDKLKLGDEGIGSLIRFEGQKNEEYALIIGKQIKDSEGHRFVRIPGQDLVYDVDINPDKLSTKFEDWIEKDLLQLSTFDVENIRVKDYSLVQAVQGTFLEPRFELASTWSSDDSQWNLDEFLTYRGKEAVPTKLLPTEELSKEKLDDLKNALGDLEIVDVRRKPKGLGTNLRVGTDFMDDRESRDSLRKCGFYPNPAGEGQFDLLATNGEVHVGMKDGVEYILRFGSVAGTEEGEEAKLNRYLLVTTRLDDSKIPVPVPPAGLEEAGKDEEAKKTGAVTAEMLEVPVALLTSPQDEEPPAEKPAAEKPAEPATETPAEQPAAESPAAGAEETSKPAAIEDAPAEKPAAETPAAETPAAEKPAAEKPAAEKPAAEKPAAEKPAAEKPAAETPAEKPAADAPAAKEGEKPAVEETTPNPDEAQAERDRLAKEYQRELDEWQEKKDKAEKKVKELNSRFAEWYYVISEDVYKKIHVGRSELIQEGEQAKEEGFGADAFRELQQSGIDKADDESTEN